MQAKTGFGNIMFLLPRRQKSFPDGFNIAVDQAYSGPDEA